jgi:predicted amidophosphoribosyltransferase
MSAILDLLFPRSCLVCGGGEELLCAACQGRLHLLRGPLCARCGAPTAWAVERCAECAGRRIPFATARAAVAYEGPPRALVAAWKDRGLRDVTAFAAGLVVEIVPRPPAAALTWIPGDRDRTLWRGHNTAEALARELGGRWDTPVRKLLSRVRAVPRQRGLARAERRRNVRGAFSSVATAPAVVTVIDDVYTTGATAAAAATELRRAGARAVHVVTFARAVRS